MTAVKIFIDDDLLFFVGSRGEYRPLRIAFKGRRSVKDLLESVGIPHVEIGRLMRDGVRVQPEDIIDDDCRLDVFSQQPRFPGCKDTTGAIGIPLFILDVHLGKLSVNLRMLGFSVDYSNSRDDQLLADLASETDNGIPRLLLSCDRGLLKRRAVTGGMVIRSRDPLVQTAEVLRRYKLAGRIDPFSRCLNCGGLLAGAGGLEALSHDELRLIPEGVRRWCDEYKRCSRCGRIYWSGCHIGKMQVKIDKILSMV